MQVLYLYYIKITKQIEIMKVLTGHLTQTNKTHINALLKDNLTEAKVNRINYLISLDKGIYTVKIAQKSKEYKSGYYISKATFKI